MSTDPLDRLLSQTLRTGRTADVCPDAEQLAAFVEHALGRDDSVAMERHLSDCARCAAIVSTLVASEPVATASAGPAWSGWHVWRWAVPTMAAVAIAGLWFASTRGGAENAGKPMVVASRELGTDPNGSTRPNLDSIAPAQEPDRPVQKSRQASAPASTAASADLANERAAGALTDAERSRTAAAAAGPAARPSAPAVETPASVRDEAANRAKDTAPAAARAEASRLQRPEAPLRAESDLQQVQKQESAASPPPSPASPPAATAADALPPVFRASSADAAAGADQARVDVGAAKSAAAAPAAAAPPAGAAAGAGRGGGGGRGGSPRAGGAPAAAAGAGSGSGTGPAPQASPPPPRVLAEGIAVQGFAPVILRNRSGNTQWRVRGVSVERSNDFGSTYAPAYTAARPLTAGAVASDDTVWLVGEAGLVVHSTADGWALAAAPVAADLIDISEVTTRGATVRARDGREFTTEDGGATWRPR